MKQRRPKAVAYRRKREQKTDYNKRLTLLLSKKPRIVIRLTNQKVIAQVVEFTSTGDKVLVGVDSSYLRKNGWKYSLKSLPASYLTGLLLGKKAKEAKIDEAILDTGFKSPQKRGKIYAFLKGVVDSGVNVPHSKEILPDDELVSGKQIADYAGKIKGDSELHKKIFTQYLKNKAMPEDIMKEFAQIKEKIIA